MIAQATETIDAIERELLGSVMRWPDCRDDTAILLQPEDFRSWPHQRIYETCLERWRRGLPIDAALVADDLAKKKNLEDVGGVAYIGELWEAAPTSANATHYAELVLDKSMARQLAAAGRTITHNAEELAGPIAEVAADAERLTAAISERFVATEAEDLSALLIEAEDRIEARVRRYRDGSDFSGISTGFVDLDGLTAGLQDSELIIAAAHPSVGKTAFVVTIAHRIALQGHGIAIFSLEQSKRELTDRMLSAESGINGQKLRKGNLSNKDFEVMLGASSKLKTASIAICDNPNQTVFEILARARRLKRKKDIRLIVIDYLQLIEPDDKKSKRYEQVGVISRRLKQLARELKIPVLCAAQLNRGVEDRNDKRPRLSDLRESGSIEQDADTVLLLHAPADQSNTLEIDVAKQRNGPTGNVKLYYDKTCMRFHNYAYGEIR